MSRNYPHSLHFKLITNINVRKKFQLCSHTLLFSQESSVEQDDIKDPFGEVYFLPFHSSNAFCLSFVIPGRTDSL